MAPLTAIAIVVGTIPFAAHAWAAMRGYFAHDDFLITFLAERGNPVDFGYLFQDYNGHLAPGLFALAWVVTWLAPLSYPAAVLPILIMQAATSILLWRLLVRLFTARPAILVPFAAVTFSPLILFTTLWWAYAAQFVPYLLAMVGALLAHTRHVQTGERRQAIVAAVWVLVGLAFYEKAVLIPVLMFGITTALAPHGRARLLWTVRQYWRLWLGYGVLIGAYAGLYLGLTEGQRAGNDIGGRLELVKRMVLDTLLPGLYGTDLHPAAGGSAGVLPPATAWQVVTIVASVGLIVGGLVVGRGRAALAWLLLAGYVAVGVALVAVARLHLVGPVIGTDGRYVADIVPVAALCAAIAFLRPSTSEQAPPRRHGLPLPARLLVAAVVAALAAGAMSSFLRLAPALRFGSAREYVANARAALIDDPGIVIYDRSVPEDVMISWFGPNARPSRVIGLLPGPPRFNRPTDALYLLDDNGTPRPLTSLTNTVTGARGPVPDCGWSVNEQITGIQLNGPIIARQVLKLEYYTARAGAGTITVGGQSTKVDFKPGLQELYLVLDHADGSAQSVDVSRAQPGPPVCVAGVTIGEPDV
ncbi:hypothetical protein EV193_1027 [Herbihabitans rhizosphaerae]|uniref:4-amino-4-deoxy-L-arabinose transferase-like glycosyltransferase n=1 Tax=Herbihabitans rhizosphaerae TaxID=1872711 RepID=A0A4Q7L4B1_9PSEU|nr:hypothetical protein [Herbihabitans rhizosphaerae]RZS43032.1 hypothetical protein EV193_1027 [Herbihabitans rhizosphaerae]